MILYTPLSAEDVFPTEAGENMQERQVVSYDGKMVYVKQTAKDDYEIVQLLSTDPTDFLNNHLQPGTKITL